MWNNFVVKFYSIVFSVLLAVSTLAFSLPGLNTSAGIRYDFANDAAGSAGGTVTVESKLPGKYRLYWGDAEGNRLTIDGVPVTEFAELTVSEGVGTADVYEYTAIPEGAETVLAFQGMMQKGSLEIPAGKLPAEETPLYTFGALSDVHFDRYNLSLTGDDAVITFTNALNFMAENGVALTAISGDVSTKSETDAFEKYNRIVSGYDFPVYTSTGNHDVGYGEFKDRWTSLINVDAYNAPVREGVSDLAPNGLDFVYAPASLHGDVFLFLSQVYWDYNKAESRLLEDEQLDWLERTLEKYRDRTVYLFFHTFMADDKGDVTRGEGNLINAAGVTYDLVYTPGTADEIRFRALLQTYKNVIFFNGHSHWEFQGVSMNPVMNVTDYGGSYATFVHVPSVSSPRHVGANDKDRTEKYMRSSQGYLVKVYADHITLLGLEFWGTRYLGSVIYNISK